jgi:adenylosuccinate synthase
MSHKEKLMRQGLLMEKQRKRDQIETKIDRCVKDLNYYSFPSDGIQSIETDKVLQAANELDQLKTMWRDLNGEINELNAGL